MSFPHHLNKLYNNKAAQGTQVGGDLQPICYGLTHTYDDLSCMIIICSSSMNVFELLPDTR